MAMWPWYSMSDFGTAQADSCPDPKPRSPGGQGSKLWRHQGSTLSMRLHLAAARNLYRGDNQGKLLRAATSMAYRGDN
eukprot:scaffold26042_cov68-Phaeocystis_antarctica.AAC.1